MTGVECGICLFAANWLHHGAGMSRCSRILALNRVLVRSGTLQLSESGVRQLARQSTPKIFKLILEYIQKVSG